MQQVILKSIGGLMLVSGLALAAGDVAAGKALYEKRCKTCHTAKKVDPTAAAAKSDADLTKVIVDGDKKHPKNKLSDEDLANVLAFVHSLKK